MKTKAKTTLYDLLGLPPTASDAAIHAAHLRLLQHYLGSAHGLPPADAENRIKAIKEAWWVLADPVRRGAYDASLLPPVPEAAGGLAQPAVLPAGALPPGSLPPGVLPTGALKVEISDVKWTPGRIMLLAIGALMIVGMLIQIFFSLFAFKQAGRVASGEAGLEAQQRVIAAERRLTYGDLTPEEIAEQEAAARRERAEQRTERARREEERKKEQALQERTYYANRVSSELQQAEEAARRQAERDRQQKEEAERRAEQEEQRRVQERVAREQARWQRELQR